MESVQQTRIFYKNWSIDLEMQNEYKWPIHTWACSSGKHNFEIGLLNWSTKSIFQVQELF